MPGHFEKQDRPSWFPKRKTFPNLYPYSFRKKARPYPYEGMRKKWNGWVWLDVIKGQFRELSMGSTYEKIQSNQNK